VVHIIPMRGKIRWTEFVWLSALTEAGEGLPTTCQACGGAAFVNGTTWRSGPAIQFSRAAGSGQSAWSEWVAEPDPSPILEIRQASNQPAEGISAASGRHDAENILRQVATARQPAPGRSNGTNRP